MPAAEHPPEIRSDSKQHLQHPIRNPFYFHEAHLASFVHLLAQVKVYYPVLR